MFNAFKQVSRLSSNRLLTPTSLHYNRRTLSAMATESPKSNTHYTFPTPNGIVPSILLEELKVSSDKCVTM